MTVAVGIGTWSRRHLLDVEGLSRDEIERILDLAVEMRRARAERRHRSLLEAEVVGLAFYEVSTRTRVSFELAAKALGATTVDLSVAGSSVAKGESLVDTLRTLERTGVTTLVLRHGSSGAAHLAARTTGLRVVNAGDGIHAHPTQALLDALTLREALGTLEGVRLVIVGDVVHSRVARSNIHCLLALGARVRVAGPPAWVAGFEEWPGHRGRHDARRGTGWGRCGDGPTRTDRTRRRLPPSSPSGGWTAERMRLADPGAVVLHPGPTNEGVELTAELANGPRSLIGRQVENGVPVRMAVLALIAGAA